MKKQTAVEWYRNTFFKALQEGLTISEGEIIFEQAIAMEKEQMEQAWRNGFSSNEGMASYYYNEKYRRTPEKYYNETYGGDK